MSEKDGNNKSTENQLISEKTNAEEIIREEQNQSTVKDEDNSIVSLVQFIFGIFGGVGYLFLLLFLGIHSDQRSVMLLSIIGIILIFIYAKKKKIKAFFFGFILPSILVLLLVGSCFGRH